MNNSDKNEDLLRRAFIVNDRLAKIEKSFVEPFNIMAAVTFVRNGVEATKSVMVLFESYIEIQEEIVKKEKELKELDSEIQTFFILSNFTKPKPSRKGEEMIATAKMKSNSLMELLTIREEKTKEIIDRQKDLRKQILS